MVYLYTFPFLTAKLCVVTRGPKERRLYWLTKSALVYEPKCGRRGVTGSQPMSTSVHIEPK
jgi:hypothetical protein